MLDFCVLAIHNILTKDVELALMRKTINTDKQARHLHMCWLDVPLLFCSQGSRLAPLTSAVILHVSGVSSSLALAMNYSANKIFDANLKNLICINWCLYRILLN
jgi:hypothetical protein